jgi:hypothetical protein
MADEYGVPEPNCAEDYEKFLRTLEVSGDVAIELHADGRGVDLLRQAFFIFEDEFRRRFPDEQRDGG